MKRCTACGLEKPEGEFHIRRASPDGLHARCKGCRSEERKRKRESDPDFRARELERTRRHWAEKRDRYNRRKQEYYRENREDILAKQAEYVVANRDRIRAYKLEWEDRNRDSVRARQRRWRSENRARVRRVRAAWLAANPGRKARLDSEWQRANRGRCNEASRRYAERHPARVKASKAAYRSRHRRAGGACTAEQLRARIDYFGGRCYVCGVLYEAVDHVKPIAAGGTHHPANLRPICNTCNSRKAAAWPLSEVESAVGRPLSHVVQHVKEQVGQAG